MNKKKLNGSYYTPQNIASFLVDHVVEKLKGKSEISILEPSAGDGIFVKTIYQKKLANSIHKFHVVEKMKGELKKIISCVKQRSLYTFHCDFLDFTPDKKYTLVIGNPPYIRSNLLNKHQIKVCNEIHSQFDIKYRNRNIWSAFLIKCINLTDSDGLLALVLPSDLLQVKMAASLRKIILQNFERVEIFTFNHLLFEDCKGQDTILFVGERKSKNKGVYYSNIDDLNRLQSNDLTFTQNIRANESKWTNHLLTSEEISLLEKIKSKLSTINKYCISKPGIVTAANKFFVLNKKIVDDYNLDDFVQPIIMKAQYVNGSVELSNRNISSLIKESKPTFLLKLDADFDVTKHDGLKKYLELGEHELLHKRYKMTTRYKWYVVPNIVSPAEGFFFRRCNIYPKIIKNSAKVLVTDSAYTINMIQPYNMDSLIYSFYNSITLIFAELQGRYYGGGVLELTPNEFKTLPIPYVKIRSSDFHSYLIKFESKISIDNILEANDKAIFDLYDIRLDIDTIKKLQSIRKKIVKRRINISSHYEKINQ